jgi:Tol biopolymer transport system component/DNA-binding winged helix-turn-helix (wHTH) protein
VEPKAFRVLLHLLRNPGRLVTKDEIVKAVWNDCSVSDNSLTRSIATVRRLLGDDPREPRYIATVQTVGYRFSCEVDVSEDTTGADAGIETASSVGSATGLADGPRHVRRNLLHGSLAKIGIIATLFSLIAAGAYLAFIHGGGWRSFRTMLRNGRSAEASKIRTTRLFGGPGKIYGPDLAPDGKAIAFNWDGENVVAGDVYVQLIGTDKPLRLTHTKNGFSCCAAWSPDGHEIAFGRCEDDGGAIYSVPALGGRERKLTDVACTYSLAGFPRWTPDGKHLLLTDSCGPASASGIVLLSLSTGEKTCISNPPAGIVADIFPRLSPDGETIAFLRVPTDGVNDIYTVPLHGGSPRRVTSDHKTVFGIMWSSDGKRIVFRSNRSGLGQLWRTSLTGQIEAETVYPQLGSLSADGRLLVYTQNIENWPSAIWRADLSQAGGQVLQQRAIVSNASNNDSAQLSPDGREIVFASEPSGLGGEIWKATADGTDAISLTSLGGVAGSPHWSPDGRRIAFDYRPGNRSQIYVMDADGRNTHVISSSDFNEVVPRWSVDGKSLFFASNRTGNYQIWKREIASGKETQLTRRGGFAASQSFDGKVLYYSKFDGAGLWSIPMDGGEERRVTTAPHRGFWGHFAVTEPGIYFVDSDAETGLTVMFYDFHSHRQKAILTLKDDPLPWTASLAASRDGRTLLFVQSKQVSSINAIEHFQ